MASRDKWQERWKIKFRTCSPRLRRKSVARLWDITFFIYFCKQSQ